MEILCVKCHAIAVFGKKERNGSKKLYCDAGHYLGMVKQALCK